VRYYVKNANGKAVIGDFGECPSGKVGIAMPLSEVAARLNELDQEVQALKAKIQAETECQSCNGKGRRWYSLYGEATCEVCRGSGQRN